MGSKKKVVIVTYGFHPPEVFAEEVGRRIEKYGLEDVVVLKFKPSCIPNNIHDLPTLEVWKLNEIGIAEQGNFLRQEFKKIDFHIDLHDTPLERYGKDLLYYLSFPGCNVKLRSWLENFSEIQKAKGRNIRIEAVPLYKGSFYHSTNIDFALYYLSLDNEELEQKLDESFKFTLEFIGYLRANYLCRN